MTFYTAAEVADLLSVHPNTVARWLRQGLPAFRVGRVVRVSAEDLERWVRLRTWHVEAGERVRSASGSSGDASRAAKSASTSTPESSFLEGLASVGASSKAAMNGSPGRGSSRRSPAEIVDFPLDRGA